MTGPERIWARRECQGFGGGWMGTWRETLHEPEQDRIGYVRADLHDEVVKALQGLLALYEDDEGCARLSQVVAARAALARTGEG